MKQVKIVSEQVRSEDGRAIASAKSVVVTSEGATTQQSVNVEVSADGQVSKSSSSSSTRRG
jgi:hypothetical protein